VTSLFTAILPIPTYQILLLLLISTFALLFGKIRFALLVNYAFSLYWAYFFNRENLLGSGHAGSGFYIFLYFGFGLVVFLLAVVGFLFGHEK